MELHVHKQPLLRAVARTHAVADKKSSMPILSNVLVTASSSGELRLCATDLYVGTASTLQAEVTTPGTVAVNARTLFDIVKNLPEGAVQWTLQNNKSVQIQAGRAKFHLPSMPGEDFPPLPNPGDSKFFAIPVERLGSLIQQTHYAMSSDDTRPHLAGAYLEGKGSLLRMVTTDGHRLSKAELTLDGDHSIAVEMLIPAKGVNELRRLLDDARADAKAQKAETPTVEIAQAGGNAFFRHGHAELSVKLSDEQFPPYDKVIPQQQTRQMTADRQTLMEALRRVSLITNDKSHGVHFHLKSSTLRVESQNPEVGDGQEELEVQYDGDDLTIGFNARYMLDAMAALTADDVHLDLNGELDPGVIRPVKSSVDFVGVIMPMRI